MRYLRSVCKRFYRNVCKAALPVKPDDFEVIGEWRYCRHNYLDEGDLKGSFEERWRK